MRAAKVDANHARIVDQLKSVLGPGTVLSMARLGGGAPDIAVGWGGKTHFYEIKDPGKPRSATRTTDDQETFRRSWPGHYAVVETAEQVLRNIGVKT